MAKDRDLQAEADRRKRYYNAQSVHDVEDIEQEQDEPESGKPQTTNNKGFFTS